LHVFADDDVDYALAGGDGVNVHVAVAFTVVALVVILVVLSLVVLF
jgi:hypothetical protein